MRERKFRGQFEGVWWYVRASDEHVSSSWEQFWALVDRKTVGEYIDRLDINDKEMYEGDVVWYQDNTSQGLVENVVVIEDTRHLPDFTCSKREEVIGNIYDNPELLHSSFPHYEIIGNIYESTEE